MCSDELHKAKLYPSAPEPIRIDRFVEKRFDITHTYRKLPDGVLGFTLFDSKGVKEIVVAEDLEGASGSANERRVRSTLAHECGHGLMHAYLFALGTKPSSLFGETDESPQILCRDVSGDRPRKYDGRWWELQANKAIGGLLMPRTLVEQVAKPLTSEVGLLGHTTIPDSNRVAATEKLANVFNVNPVVARIRLENIFPRIENQGTL